MTETCSHTRATAADSTSLGGLCPRCLLGVALAPSVETMSYTPGLILDDRFRINALAGRGGMGEVYRADDLTLGQVVALKFVPIEIEQDDEIVARLRNEVRVGRQVSHPNVCRLYELREVEGRHFVVMEFIDGEDLGALVERAGRLPTATALSLGREICAGLAASHDRDVVHGDLKPSNIMVDRLGHARLTDFGLSTLRGEGDGSAAGTPAYMAPEQLAGGASTRLSDLYALGVVLFELFTGERPQADRVTQKLKGVPADLQELIESCLSFDPSRRPTSPRQVLAAFPGSDLLEAAIAAGETPSPELVAAAESIRPLPTTAAWATLLFTIALIGLELAAVSIASRTPRPTPQGWTLYLLILPLLLVAGLITARRNIRLERVDARGALRIAAWVFACRMLAWAFEETNPGSVDRAMSLLADALGRSLFFAAQAWLGYLAVEPYIRRRHPQTIIGWRRLLDGRVTDSIVGRDVLIGSGVGAVMALLSSARAWVTGASILPAISSSTLAMILYFQARAIFYALFGLFLLVLLRNALKPRILGSIVWVAVAATLFADSPSPIEALFGVTLAIVVLVCLVRFGLLATSTALFSFLTLSFAAEPRIYPVAVLLVALAAAGFLIHQAGARKEIRDAV